MLLLLWLFARRQEADNLALLRLRQGHGIARDLLFNEPIVLVIGLEEVLKVLLAINAPFEIAQCYVRLVNGYLEMS